MPFAAKDNIDALGLPTTAACPAFAYAPTKNATIIQRLLDAGAIMIGKTNLDQFATGLVGVRSPYGTPTNTFNPEYVSGGSSSGSASVVARGAFSNTDVVPTCRTLDCVSVFATINKDAVTIYDVAAARDLTDGLSRAIPTEAKHKSLPAKPRFGIPAKPEFYDDALAEKSLVAAIKQLEAQGATCVPIDFSIFHEVAALLYDGPGVAERYAAIQAFATAHATLLNSAVRPRIGQLGTRPQHHHKLLRDHHVYYRSYRQSR